jgi:hypothetical protein
MNPGLTEWARFWGLGPRRRGRSDSESERRPLRLALAVGGASEPGGPFSVQAEQSAACQLEGLGTGH